MRLVKTIFITIIIIVVSTTIRAAAPPLINFQGRLGDASGNPLDTTVSITFTIYDVENGGVVKWSEIQPAVSVKGGIFNVILGSITPVHDSVFSGVGRWLGIKVGSDTEIIPRSRLVSVGYSLRVSTVDGAKGGAITDNLILQASGPSAKPTLDFGLGYGNDAGLLFRGNGSNANRSIAMRFDQGTISGLTIGSSNYNPDPDLVTGWTDLVTFYGNGNVGIGTSAPDYPLDVIGNIRSSAGVIAGILWTGDGTSGNIRKLTAGIPLYFRNSAGTQEMTIDGSGNVGIGTTNPFMRNVIKILLYTGMRRSELVYLQWSDLDFVNKLIAVQSKPEFGFHPKSYRPRSIPMSLAVHQILMDLPQKGEFLFDNGHNQPLRHEGYYYREIKKIFKKTGIKNANLHALRHTFASHLVMAGTDLRTVQQLLGHSTFQITERYSHLSPKHLTWAVESLDFETKLKQISPPKINYLPHKE